MAGPSSTVVRPRRRWPRRLLIAANVFVAICVLAVAGAYGYFRYQYGRIPTFDSLGSIFAGGNDDPGDPMNVLLVGSDSRAVIDESERRSFGSERQVGGQRSDTMIVLHVDPRAERAAMLSIPRDLYVPIAGTQGRCERGLSCSRINSAFEGKTPEEGAARLIQTIQQALGIPIDHYVQVDFNGFRGLVEAVGGVDMYIPSPVRDRDPATGRNLTGLDISETGCVRLDGNMALAWVRSRHFQVFEGGRWRFDPTGDLGRIERQQEFIRRAVKKAVSRAATNPVTLQKLINTGVQNVTIDEGLGPDVMLRLANRFRSLQPGAVEMYTIPTEPARRNGAAVLLLKEPEATETIDKFLGRNQPVDGGDVPAGVDPADVRVRVLNGTGVGGQASQAAAALRDAGFRVSGLGDADTFRYDATEIRYASDAEDKAKLLQAHVKGRSRLRADPTLRGSDIVLITGQTWAGLQPVAGQPPAQPTAPPPTEAPAEEPKGDPADDQC